METPLDILKTYWGYPSFRPLQEKIITSVIARKDTLALLPTGGGKSLCFQIPALLMEGVTLVVSPLIALMKDQVRQLTERGISADAIYSGMRSSDIDRILDNAVFGSTKLLYLSPERLLTEVAKERIARMRLSLVAVDEAHCISQWGYDFRPPYLRIAELREAHPDVPFVAVTATATPEVVRDIRDKLEFRTGGLTFQQSFARSNLAYIVRRPPGKGEQLVSILDGVPGSSIVYARSRGLTKELAHNLSRRSTPAAAYHAGLEAEVKDERQSAWIDDRLRVMVATNAFGMGIDKPDVRSVIHYGPPDSPEAYFQEAGRAGRDGKGSYAVLLYHPRDGERLIRNWELSYPSISEIKRLYRALGSFLQLAVGGGKGDAFAFDLTAFSQNFGFDIRQAYSGLKALEKSGYILLTEDLQQAATVQITVSQEALYNYRLKHPRVERLMKSILRTTQGAFINPVRLKEGALANFLNLDKEELSRTLKKLHAEGVIDYRPEQNGPQIVFVEERIDPVNLRIDEAQYNFLKKRARERIDTMIDYCENDRGCRSQRLLRYFGEMDPPVCGQCDVCRRNQASAPSSEQVYDKLKVVLNTATELEVSNLAKIFGTSSLSDTTAKLQELINEGLIVREGNKLRMP